MCSVADAISHKPLFPVLPCCTATRRFTAFAGLGVLDALRRRTVVRLADGSTVPPPNSPDLRLRHPPDELRLAFGMATFPKLYVLQPTRSSVSLEAANLLRDAPWHRSKSRGEAPTTTHRGQRRAGRASVPREVLRSAGMMRSSRSSSQTVSRSPPVQITSSRTCVGESRTTAGIRTFSLGIRPIHPITHVDPAGCHSTSYRD